jgi:colicin import membrane protein
MTRTANDWGSLVLSEIRGDEQPGTVAKLVAETTGKPVADDGLGAETKGLLRLLELLHRPGDLKKQIADLDRSATAATTAAAQAKAEQAKLAQAKQDLAAERAKHEAAIAHEVRNHQAVMVAAQAELASVKKQAADLKAKAEADAAAASKAKSEATRRLRLMEGAAA